MAIEIPHEVAMFLNFVGVPYPDINEDRVRQLAGHVRTFAQEVADTHAAASGAISDMGAVYQGQSYRALVASWARLGSSHMERLDELCGAVVTALEIAAEVIAAVKIAVSAELGLLATAYGTAMAATVAAAGTSAALGRSITAAAKQLVKAMEQMLIAYILAEVLGKAIEPLEDAVGEMITGVVYDAAADLLGVDTGGNDVLHIDPDEVRRYAQVLDDHADDIMGHAERFAGNVAALDFTTPVGPAPAHPGPPGTAPAGPGRPLFAGIPAAQRASRQHATALRSGAGARNWIPETRADVATGIGSAAAVGDGVTTAAPDSGPAETVPPPSPRKTGAPEASDGPAPVSAEVSPANPWNRPPPGSVDTGSGKGAARDPAGPAARAPRGRTDRRRGSGRPNPWSVRPASEAEPARTPWAKPDHPAARVPTGTAARDSIVGEVDVENPSPPSGDAAVPGRRPAAGADPEQGSGRPGGRDDPARRHGGVTISAPGHDDGPPRG